MTGFFRGRLLLFMIGAFFVDEMGRGQSFFVEAVGKSQCFFADEVVVVKAPRFVTFGVVVDEGRRLVAEVAVEVLVYGNPMFLVVEVEVAIGGRQRFFAVEVAVARRL